MGTWSSEAPTLPSGSEWEQEKPSSYTANYWSMKTTRSIARLAGNTIAVKVVSVVGNGSYGSYSSPGYYYLRCKIDDATDTDTSIKITKGTTTLYYMGEAAAGTAIAVAVGCNGVSKSVSTLNFTAPALLGNTVFVNIGGAWKQGTMFVNVSGVWKQCFPKVNIGGVWK